MMSTDDVEKLERNRPKLMRGLKLEDGLLLAELRAQKIITQHQEEIIHQAGANTLKVGELVDCLLKGDCSTLGHFRDAMLATNHAALEGNCFGTNTATDLPTRPPLDLSNPEFYHARKLAEDKDARENVLEKLCKQSKKTVHRRSLLEVVRELGLQEKLLVYLVFLVPEVCEQIGRLFVIRRAVDCSGGHWRPVNFQYYQDLLGACKHVESKNTLIRALVDAEVSHYNGPLDELNSESFFDLLKQLNNEQCATLLNKTHNLQLCVKDEQQSTISLLSIVASEIALGVIYLYDCAITADCFQVRDFDLPVCMLTRNISGVKHLKLTECELCEEVPGYMPRRDRLAPLEHQPPSHEDCSLEEVEFWQVTGMAKLRHCQGAITSHPCRLSLSWCDTVKVTDLKRCFPKIQELLFDSGTVIKLDDATQTTRGEDLCTSEEDEAALFVNKIGLIVEFLGQPLHSIKVDRLESLFSLQVDVITKENKSVVHNILLERVSVPLTLFLEGSFLPGRRLEAENVGDASYPLSEFKLVDSNRGLIHLAQILAFCSRCFQMDNCKVNVKCFRLLVDEDKLKSVPQIPGKVSFIFQIKQFFSEPDATLLEPKFGQEIVHKSVLRVCPLSKVEFENY